MYEGGEDGLGSGGKIRGGRWMDQGRGGRIRGGGIDQGRQVDGPLHSSYCLVLLVTDEPHKAGAEKGRSLRPPTEAATQR